MSQLIKRFNAITKPNNGIGPLGAETNAEGSDESAVASSALEFSEANAGHRLRLFSRSHRWDPNIGDDELAEVTGAAAVHDTNTEAKLVERIIENSPYPEVRFIPIIICHSNNQLDKSF